MKKIVVCVLSALFAVMVISCQKKMAAFANSAEASEKLCGSWKLSQKIEMNVYKSPDEPEDIVGVAKASNSFIISFFPDLSYTMECSQMVDSFAPNGTDGSIDVDTVKNQFSYSVTLKGFFAASADVLQLINKSVVLESGEEIPVEEYSKYDSSITGDIVESLWSIDGDNLVITSNGDEKVSVSYKRM